MDRILLPALFLLAFTLVAPAVSADALAPSTDDSSASCVRGGDLPVLWNHIYLWTGTCAGIEIVADNSAPYACPYYSPPCYVKFVVTL